MSTKYLGENNEYGPFEVRDDGLPCFGDIVSFFLGSMGWKVKQFGELYGKAVKNEPYTRERIYQMIREDAFPDNPGRRWVIARLLQIPPAVLGISVLDDLLPKPAKSTKEAKAPLILFKKGKLDIEEFGAALHAIKQQYHACIATTSLREINVRIRYLHDEVLYRNRDEAQQIKQLVCGYQMTAGNILRDQFHVDEAVPHLNKAILVAKESILAREKGFEKLYVDALIQRGVLFLDKGKIAAPKNWTTASRFFALALHDFQEAHRYLPHLDLEPYGTILLLRGTILAHTAQDRMELATALKDIDAAHRIVQEGSEKDQGIYYLDRASAFIASPAEKLHNPTNAFEALEEASHHITRALPRRYVYMHVIEAAAHFDNKWYSTATELAREALALMKEHQSGVNVARLAAIHERLQASNYGKSIEVAELGIDLMKIQHPEVFH